MGTFDPKLIAKYQRRFLDFDDKIISMYARGMTVREIRGHLEEIYGIDVSPDLKSTVTEAVLEAVTEWQGRPLDACYPLVFFDAIRALKTPIALRSPPRGCIFHSGRGSQYPSHDYQRILREHGLHSSMNGKENCHDNAVVETFLKPVKAEMIWRRIWETRRQAATGIFQYINGFNNPCRRHSALGGKSPLAFERQAA